MRTLAGVIALVACGDDPVAERVDQIVALEGDDAAGAVIYEGYCAQCHGADGAGVTSDPDLSGPPIDGIQATDLAINVLDPGPEMPSFRTLTDQEIADVAAWVASL